MDIPPHVATISQHLVDAIGGRRSDFIARIQSRLDVMRKTLEQEENFDSLSIIRDIPSEVLTVFRSDIASVENAMMVEVRVMNDNVCTSVSERQGCFAGAHAGGLASTVVDNLPAVIRSSLDACLSESHVAMSRHVEFIAKVLQHTYVSPQDFADVAMKLTDEVQQILSAKVVAAMRECLADVHRKIASSSCSFNEPQSVVPLAENMYVAQHALICTVEDVVDEAEKMDSAVLVADETLAETLSQAETFVTDRELRVSARGHHRYVASSDHGSDATLPFADPGMFTPNDIESYAISPNSSLEHITTGLHEVACASPGVLGMSLDTRDRGCISGSFGHPEFCSRPCVFAAVGQCVQGLSCAFCHMTHKNRAVCLDKKRRETLKRMTYEERVASILPIVQLKIVQLGLDEDLLRDISYILYALQPLTYASVLVRSMQRVQSAPLTKFTLRSLFAMMRSEESECAPSELYASVGRLFSRIQIDYARTSQVHSG